MRFTCVSSFSESVSFSRTVERSEGTVENPHTAFSFSQYHFVVLLKAEILSFSESETQFCFVLFFFLRGSERMLPCEQKSEYLEGGKRFRGKVREGDRLVNGHSSLVHEVPCC